MLNAFVRCADMVSHPDKHLITPILQVGAKELLTKMQSRGVKTGVHVFTTMLKGYCAQALGSAFELSTE